MKRLFMVLLVIVYVTTVLLSAILPVVKAEGAQHEELPGVETGVESEGENGGEQEAMQPVWLSYIDYLRQESAKDFADPARNVGYEAVFNLRAWQSFICTADPAAGGASWQYITHEDLKDTDGNSIRVKIINHAVDASGNIWYQVEAVGRSTLPIAVEEKSYIYHLDSYSGDKPSLIMLPQKAMFLTETVEIKKTAEFATHSVVLPTAELPVFFDVRSVMDEYGDYYYDLGDTTGWHADLAEKGYHYVDEACVYLIAPEVTVAYERLQQATSAKEYNEIWESIPESVRQQFTEQHMAVLNERQEELNNVTYSQTVMYNGTELGVSVSGPIPEQGVTLHVGAVADEDILNGGFDVKSATDIITALDIKLLREDSSEWQPEDSERIYVSIDVAALGIEDETVVQLHHKHGEEIYTFEVVGVFDGQVTVGVNGLSVFIVDRAKQEPAANATADYNNNGTITMEVGDEKYFYVRIRNGNQNINPNTPGNWVGTWQVTDPTGAVFYEVFSQQAPNHNAGMWVAWIRIVALKEVTGVSLKFNYAQVTYQYNNPQGNPAWNTESYTLNIERPKSNDGKSLYLKDTVNTDGRITAVLVDNDGNEITNGLAGAAFSWKRSDGLFIVPQSYENEYRSINIVRDHAGLVEARKEDGDYVPVTYTLTAKLADGTTEEAEYTVYYQSEFLNRDFEDPKVTTDNYSFYPNGWADMYWKTTAPGTGGDLIRDIEYGHIRDGAADFNIPSRNGEQFAELNAQEFGALYQDIITVPREDIKWEFSHAPRGTRQNRMFVVIGPTEEAQKLTEASHLEGLGDAAKAAADRLPAAERNAFYDGTGSVVFTYNGATYTAWYHDAADDGDPDGPWTDLSGVYEVPEGQYRTRLFFVTDADGITGSSDNKNYGNLIDSSAAGQYKTYMIEYYEQTYVDGELQTVRVNEKEETGRALVYSSEVLDNYDYFIESEHDYLYKILINGQNYPYDIRYSGKASLYIEHYDGEADDLIDSGKETEYAKYDIVMQVVLRDTVIAVQKVLEFPYKLENPEAPESATNKRIQLLTEEQKLKIMEDLRATADGGYKATFELDSPDASYPVPEENYPPLETKSAVVTSRDPYGNYTGFVALGENPYLGYNYQIEETDTTKIVGLELDSVTFEVTRYKMGQLYDEIQEVSYEKIKIEANTPLVCNPFKLEEDIKIADVTVTNTYVEKMTTIYYKAVGKGKVELTTGGGYQDIPSEKLAFYSGQAVGAVQQAGNGATFVGWFTDPECKNPITAADGVYDETTKIFKPNTNIINADEVTFYAKFDTGAIVINREDAFPGQIFVYRVQQTDQHGNPISNGAEFYVTVAPDEKGKYSETIVDVPAGYYTVTEIGNWSWRHPPEQKTEWHRGSGEVVYTFTNPTNQPNWLSGLSDILKNVFTGTGGVS